VASANFMRLSLLKGAHAASSSAAWQEIRVRGWTPAAGRCSVNVEGEFEMDDAQRRLILSLSNGESKAHDGCMTFMPWIMLAAARHPRPTLTRSCSLWTTGCGSAPVNVALLGSVIDYLENSINDGLQDAYFPKQSKVAPKVAPAPHRLPSLCR
jgi:hypothetical protein